MPAATCHCGAHRITAPAPDSVTRCNCSICAKRGVLWAYYTPEAVNLEVAPERLTAYCWGDRCITFFHCAVCGCSVYSENEELVFDGRTYPARITLNAQLFDDFDWSSVSVREVDGRSH